MKHLSLLLALTLLMLGLGACGQSGPLYLPPPKTPAQLSGSSQITRPQTTYQQNQPGENLNQTNPSATDMFTQPADDNSSS
jgi:predicted small lipoprotein YifL